MVTLTESLLNTIIKIKHEFQSFVEAFVAQFMIPDAVTQHFNCYQEIISTANRLCSRKGIDLDVYIHNCNTMYNCLETYSVETNSNISKVMSFAVSIANVPCTNNHAFSVLYNPTILADYQGTKNHNL